MKYIKRSLSYIAVLITTGLLTACASGPVESVNPNKYLFPELEEVSSIREYDIDSWSEVDSKSLIVNTSPSKSYLIILKHPNRDLRHAHAISFGRQGRIYSKFDRIYLINSMQGVQSIPTYIERIYKLTSREQKNKIRDKIRNKEQSEDSKNPEAAPEATTDSESEPE